MLSFKPTSFLSSFTFIKRLFSSSLLSALRVVSSAYLRLLVILPTILIPACASSSMAFCMMYSLTGESQGWQSLVGCHLWGCTESDTTEWLSSSSSSNSECKLNKYTALMYSFPYLKPVCCSMSSSNCCFLTCIQISQEADQVVWCSHLFQNFPQFVVIHTVKGFGIVNKADVILEFSCFFNDQTDVGNLISGSSAFSKSSLNIWKFTVHVLLKPGLENFEHYFTSV